MSADGMHPRAMTDSGPSARRYLACVSDPSRFRLILALSSGARCVTDLAQAVGLSQSCTTRHLQAMRREGIVEADRLGKRVMIRLALEGGALNPALAWALGREAPPVAAGEAVARGAGAGRPRTRPGRAGGGAARRTADHERRAEPTDAGFDIGGATLHVESAPIHESGWSDDQGPGAGTGPAPVGSDEEAAKVWSAPPARSADLDDFLL